MTLKGLIEEELMESKAIIDALNSALSDIIGHINLNEKLDRENDCIRTKTRKQLLASIREYKMSNYEEADNHVHAALQTLDEQEIVDTKDDIPRHEARLKLAVVQAKLTRNSELIRKFLGKLNQKDPSDDQAS